MGKYQQVIANSETFLKEDKVLNFTDNLEIKMTQDKGRGIFASEDLRKGDLIVVERAIA